MKVTVETARELGLLPEEFEMIKKILGRDPNYTELSIYSVMWSEHASYKNSIRWIKTLPTKGKALLAETGAENAGLVDIGDGLGCAFKIESHNHPSAMEPYQGAATGVGGITRDIFTMGARPIAQLNSLRFGDINLEKTKWLIRGVVKGMGDYGNTLGVPMVAGEVFFDDSFNTNPLVNAMSVGIVQKGMVVSAIAKGVGNPVYIVGSATGRDGVHGTTFASASITESSAEELPPVQVGDPFVEKLLLEATLEVIPTGALIGMQDMGAAGIICSTSEMSAKGKHGMRVYLDRVPIRHQNIEPWEILLSESQERMLIVVKKGSEKKVEEIFKKWDIPCTQIGEVTEGNMLEFLWHGELVANVPAQSLVVGGGAPVYDREYREPAYFNENKKFTIDQVDEPGNLKEIAYHLIKHPNIASKRWIYEQFDTMAGNSNMTINFPSSAGVVSVKGSGKALVMTVDCNSRYVKADPEVGTMIAVAESARNIVCTGGKPLAISNCLNFGDPYNPEVYWQFVKSIKGMSRACEKFETPVTGGNVSFYNQSSIGGKDESVFPTPTIGMLGLMENKNHHTTLAFKEKGHMIFLIGRSRNDIASSQYLYSYHGIKNSPAPYFDLDEEYAVQQAVLELISKNLIQSANDVSDGGLFITLVESAIPRQLGFDITTDAEIRTDAFLFGEAQGRIVVSVSPSRETQFIDHMIAKGIPFTTLGHVTKSEVRIDDESYGFIADIKREYENAFTTLMEGK
ncbi:MAG TPA: phosphoribosylformylglycinamidine synthase subunit PurL [Tenuifilaceae bacterium]|nr:phosphoribosylformylglycinamidine synthase subunit PurL [Tenuifilaceae bacterium]